MHLRHGERISAIDDRSVDDDFETATELGSIALHHEMYIDLTVSSDLGERRVLVLLH